MAGNQSLTDDGMPAVVRYPETLIPGTGDGDDQPGNTINSNPPPNGTAPPTAPFQPGNASNTTGGGWSSGGPPFAGPPGRPPSGNPPHGLRAPPSPAKPTGPLKVIVVGAGVGGLTAAASLRQAGHEVKLFEQSRFSNEIGAAIHVGPNATRLLSKLGYDPVRLRGVKCQAFGMFKSDGTPLVVNTNKELIDASGSPWFLAHRVDLHNELKHLALDAEGPGKPAELFLESRVTQVDEEEGIITLENGTSHQADLIVGADGIHSRIRELVFNPEKPKPTTTAAYRFVVDSNAIYGNPDCLPLVAGSGQCSIIIGGPNRVVIYPCRDDTLLNVVCLHESEVHGESAQGWNTSATVDDVLEKFNYFSPLITNIIKMGESVKRWQLLERDSIPTWVKGRLCLIGDAAHPMLPHQGQGGGQAMEDGAALGPLFPLETKSSSVPEALQFFQGVRHERASKVQWLSANQFFGSSVQIDPAVSQKFIFNHDVIEFAKHYRASRLIL